MHPVVKDDGNDYYRSFAEPLQHWYRDKLARLLEVLNLRNEGRTWKMQLKKFTSNWNHVSKTLKFLEEYMRQFRDYTGKARKENRDLPALWWLEDVEAIQQLLLDDLECVGLEEFTKDVKASFHAKLKKLSGSTSSCRQKLRVVSWNAATVNGPHPRLPPRALRSTGGRGSGD